VSIIGKEGKGSICSKATKSIPTEGTSMPCKGKSSGRRKEVEEDKERKSNMHGQATRSAARVEEKLSSVINFIWSYLYQFFDDSHGLKASLKPLKRPFNLCQSCLEVINNGQDIKQINW